MALPVNEPVKVVAVTDVAVSAPEILVTSSAVKTDAICSVPAGVAVVGNDTGKIMLIVSRLKPLIVKSKK